MKYIFGIFLILHAMVHLLYAGQSIRLFALKPGMVWPDGAWAFSRFLGNGIIRNLAGISLLLIAISMIASGAGFIANQTWSRPVVIGAALVSCAVFMLLWNGKLQNLDGQGAVGIVINILLLLAVFLLRGQLIK